MIASASGLASLAAIVTGVLWWISNDSPSVLALVVANGSVAAFACLVWSGVLWKTYAPLEIDTTTGWLGTGALGAAFASLFVWLDCGNALPSFRPVFACQGTLGWSAALTIAALLVTAIAIPSALRAALLQRFDRPSLQTAGETR